MQRTPGQPTQVSPTRTTTIDVTQHEQPNKPNIPPKAPQMPGTTKSAPLNDQQSGNNINKFLGNNYKKGLAIGGTALAVGTGAYLLHRRNKKKREEKERLDY